MLRRWLCRIGWHDWTILSSSWVGDERECKHCKLYD